MFKTGKVFKLDNPAPVIPTPARSLIRGLVENSKYAREDQNTCYCRECRAKQWKEINMDVWKTDQGKLPKRIERIFYKATGLKLTPKEKEEIGNIARSAMAKAYCYYFDFTQKYNWDDGDFGDGGSCFWGERSLAREILENNETRAIRFYKDEDGEVGYARAWIVFDENGNPVVFNGYGLEAQEIATFLATYLDLEPHRVDMDIPNDPEEIIYSNCDAYVLLPKNSSNPETVSIPLVVECETCRDCGNWHWINDMYDTPHGSVCKDCAEKCACCGEYFIPYYLSTLGGKEYCSDCLTSVTRVES